MYFPVTYMAFILISFVHEMVNNNCKHKEEKFITFVVRKLNQGWTLLW